MSGDGEGGRLYSDEEFALILRRASEVSETGEARSEGLSLSEIQHIAQEAGIDPAAVARAAANLPEHNRDRLVTLFGGPTKYRLEQTLTGRVSEEDLSRILQAIRRVATHQGKTEHVLDSLEWQTVGEVSQVFVNVSARDDGTTIEVVGDRGPAGVLTFLPPAMVSLIGSLVLGSTFEPSAALGVAIAGVLGGTFIVARTVWNRTGAAFRKKLGTIMDEASRTAEGALKEGRSEPTALSPGGGGGASSDE